MSIGKHSFVAFYPSDWLAGTIRMPRPARSVYFDLCCYTWDKAEPVPKGVQTLMFMDLEGMGEKIVASLIETGQLVQNEDGSVYSPRALSEARKAYELWEKKSEGGRAARKAKSVPTVLEESSREPSPEPSPDPEPQPSSEVGSPSSVEPIAPGWDMIPDAWNAIAAKTKLRPIAKMTDERVKRLKARVADHGVNTILEAIETIPASPFLMGGGERGWKAHFDWLVQPKSCALLIEGWYHENGENDGNGNRQSGNAYVNAALEREAERAAGKS